MACKMSGMATTNYIKVRSEDRCHEFFFDKDDPVSVATARSNAWELADVLMAVGGKKGVHLSVWEHAPECAGMTCVGGCVTCSPANGRNAELDQ